MTIDGVRCATDGIRCDVYGNLWCSSNAGRNVGYSGVTVWNPEGQLIGRIRLPEVCANVAFGGPERNRLFIDRKSTRLNSSHSQISYAVFCLKKKKTSSHYHTDSS